MREKITIKNIEKAYKNLYLIITTLAIYLLIILLKDMFYELFNLNINNLTNIEKNIINITYQIFAIIIPINFLIKNKNIKLENFKEYLKNCKIALLTIIIYSLTPTIELLILYYSKTNIEKLSINEKTTYLIIIETLILIIIGLINKKTLLKNIKDIKINFKKYIDKYLKYYIYSIIIMMVSNILINLIYPSIAGNQQSVINTLKKAPIYMVFSATIFAPFMEEMIFRQSIRHIIKDNLTFIITSGLIFGGMHVIGNINNFYDVLYLIPYSAPGIAFAYILTKTNNILVPISIHFMHNTITVILQMILLFVI